MRVVWLAVACALIALFCGLFGPSSASAREIVTMREGTPGMIIVRTQERRLYYIMGNGKAVRYRVGVGRVGMQWSGRSYVRGMYIQPAWKPPADVRRDSPNLPRVIPGGAPNNPMGVAALTLNGGEYAIHGTNNPSSIGHFVSYGCIRMYNHDIMDLFARVHVGTQVLVTR
jgi:lipoprotein-anchoring transpeptidase ErfK/SrfK